MNRDLSANNFETAAWLTYLDEATQEKFEDGAIEAIDLDVTRHEGKHGVVLQAGPEPTACDTNRLSRAYELLQSVSDAIILIRTTSWRSRCAEDPDRPQRWFEPIDR